MNRDLEYEMLVEFPKYRALCKSIVIQFLMDLKSRSKKKTAKVDRIKAMSFLNLQNKNFIIACSRADLDPKYVWEKSQEIKKNNPMIK